VTWPRRFGCAILAAIVFSVALYLMVIGGTSDCGSDDPCLPDWERVLLFFGSPIVAMLLVSWVGYRLGKRDF
jgi:hypothetical protein